MCFCPFCTRKIRVNSICNLFFQEMIYNGKNKKSRYGIKRYPLPHFP